MLKDTERGALNKKEGRRNKVGGNHNWKAITSRNQYTVLKEQQQQKTTLIVKVKVNTGEQQRDKHRHVKQGLQNHKIWGRKARTSTPFFFFFRMCLSLYDYQTKASRYKKGLTYFKNRKTTNQNQTNITFMKPKKKRTQTENKRKSSNQKKKGTKETNRSKRK